jgi:hypothetical protein
MRQGLTAVVNAPNSDNACGLSVGSPWTVLTGMSISVNLPVATEVELGFTGSIGDLNARTEGLHCGVRFLVDGAVVAGADASFGHFMWSTNNYMWHASGSERQVALAAGVHTITVEGRSGLCAGAGDPGLCHFSNVDYGLVLNVLVP